MCFIKINFGAINKWIRGEKKILSLIFGELNLLKVIRRQHLKYNFIKSRYKNNI